MSTTADLVTALKKELKSAQMTYADLATALGMAESSVKRMLAKGDMPLSRIDAICRALKLDFADLARRVADAQPLLAQLSAEQERAVVADKKLLLVAICALSQWTFEQIVATYALGRNAGKGIPRHQGPQPALELGGVEAQGARPRPWRFQACGQS